MILARAVLERSLKSVVEDNVNNLFLQLEKTLPLSLSGVEIIVPEIVKYDETHTIIHVHIPPSAEVHRYKK